MQEPRGFVLIDGRHINISKIIYYEKYCDSTEIPQIWTRVVIEGHKENIYLPVDPDEFGAALARVIKEHTDATKT